MTKGRRETQSTAELTAEIVEAGLKVQAAGLQVLAAELAALSALVPTHGKESAADEDKEGSAKAEDARIEESLDNMPL